MSSPSPTSKPARRRPLLIGALALLLIGVIVAIVKLIQSAPSASEAENHGGAPPGPPPAAVFVAPVKVEDAQYESMVTGTLRAASRAEVAATESEAVAEVLADDGDRVTKGDRLVRLDDRRINAQIAEAQAQLQGARSLFIQRQAELTRVRTDLAMKKGLLSDKAISRSEFLDAESALAVAEAQHAAAAQAVAEAESRSRLLDVRRQDLEIRAPFTGVIAARHVELGEWISAGQAVMTLVTVDPVEAWMSVPERYLADLTNHPEGARVRLSSSGEIFKPARVVVVPDVESRSQLFTVVATIDNPRALLAPGQSITGIVPVGPPEPHFIVPVDALIRAHTGDSVFVADASGAGELPVARKVPVKVRFERDARVFIRSVDAGLKKDDRVIIEGNDRLQPGQPLLVREGGKPSEPPPSPTL